MEARPGYDALVIGGGIAGLTSAIALQRVGLRARILERATALTQAGTALSLWPNTRAALSELGLSSALSDIGVEEPGGIIRDWTGREIVTLDQTRLSQHLGTPTLVVHRGRLQQLLLGAASDIPIAMHTTVSHIASDGDGGVVTTSSGETLHAPLVVACDGIRSVARPAMGNPRPRFTGRTSWRAVLGGASHLVSGACLTTGQGKQFIASNVEGGLVYWAADVGLPEGANEAMVGRKEFLLRQFSRWHDPICELIRRTDEEDLVIADVFDSVPRRLFRDRIVALGDAAHPMTPDLGQGACQAIEDAVVLAACLSEGRDVSQALARYEAARLRRVRMVVRSSRRLGRIATTDSKVGSRMRDAFAAHMPDWLNRKLVGRYASTASFLKTLPQAA